MLAVLVGQNRQVMMFCLHVFLLATNLWFDIAHNIQIIYRWHPINKKGIISADLHRNHVVETLVQDSSDQVHLSLSLLELTLVPLVHVSQG